MKKVIVLIISLLISQISMAYNIHIQKENYWELANPNIDKEKWLSFCESDPTMEIQDSIVGINPKTKEKLVIKTEGTCIWHEPKTNDTYVFHYSGSRITFGTEDVQIEKAKEIADFLGLKVYGDEGETY